MATSGSAVLSSPQIPSPAAPNYRKNLILREDQKKNGTFKLQGSENYGNNTSCYSDKGVVLAKGHALSTMSAQTARLITDCSNPLFIVLVLPGSNLHLFRLT